MHRQTILGGLIAVAQLVGSHAGFAGPWEDGMAAYNRGDYVPAIQLFRALAREGNARAQGLLGVMYRRGQGVARNPQHAFVWLNRASAQGDAGAKVQLHELSQSMSREEWSQARAMVQACEASNYRDCEY